jgi:quercetin dioxygenase-like cupin family protein
MTTLGPADVSVRTVELAPGESTGWHRHPGFETTIVNAGELTVQTAEQCAPRRVGAGEAVFVPDAEPHVMRNDGTVPAQLVVTQVLAPGAADRSGVAAACGGSALR